MTNLSEDFLQKLATDTADWMQDLYSTGFEDLLAEGLMVVPIGKALIKLETCWRA
jgi:hypothetical protein